MAQNYYIGAFGQLITADAVANTLTLNTVTTHNGNTIFANNILFNAGANVYANGSLGTAGQALTSNGSSVYWSTPAAGVNLASSYAFTNTTASVNATSGAITTAGGIGVANNVYVGGRVGFANTTTSVAYMQYNATTGSLDVVFG